MRRVDDARTRPRLFILANQFIGNRCQTKTPNSFINNDTCPIEFLLPLNPHNIYFTIKNKNWHGPFTRAIRETTIKDSQTKALHLS